MPHVTVAVPAYNRAHLLPYTIECVLRQTHTDFDLLIVDDASTDDTEEVVAEYLSDPRVRYVRNAENLGLTRNWNRCLELSTGPLIQLLLSDDLMDPDYLAEAAQAFDEHPGVGFVAASCRYIDAENKVFDAGRPREPRLYHAGDDALKFLFSSGFPHVSGIVVRKACFETLGRFDEDLWHGPDVEMDARIAQRYDVFDMGRVGTSFRRHGSNMGNLEFLNKAYLSVHVRKFEIALGYLSKRARHELGIADIRAEVWRGAANASIVGAVAMLSYRRADLTRHYLSQSIHYDWRCLRTVRFWKAALLACLPAIAQRVMARRMHVTRADASAAVDVTNLLGGYTG